MKKKIDRRNVAVLIVEDILLKNNIEKYISSCRAEALQIVDFVLGFHFCLSRSTYKLFTYMCILIDKFGKVRIQNVKIRLFER